MLRPPTGRRGGHVVLAADLVERDVGDPEILGKCGHGLRPNELVELLAGEHTHCAFLCRNQPAFLAHRNAVLERLASQPLGDAAMMAARSGSVLTETVGSVIT